MRVVAADVRRRMDATGIRVRLLTSAATGYGRFMQTMKCPGFRGSSMNCRDGEEIPARAKKQKHGGIMISFSVALSLVLWPRVHHSHNSVTSGRNGTGRPIPRVDRGRVRPASAFLISRGRPGYSLPRGLVSRWRLQGWP